MIGGPGMGKSTLAKQAMLESVTLDRGDEWLIRCRQDWGATELHQNLSSALGLQADLDEATADPDPASAVSQFLWTRAPQSVGVVIDDVHELTDGGLDYLLGLRQLLPSNAHLLLATREHPRVVASLMTADPDLVVDGGDLLFDAVEIEGFARVTGLDPASLQAAGGWPAVLALTASAGPDVAGAYLYQRVLAGLSRQQQGDLAVAAALGEVDADLAPIVLDGSVHDLGALPLVELTAGGGLQVHELWRDPLRGLVDPGRLADAVRAAARHAEAAGGVDHAIGLLYTHGLVADGRELIVRQVSNGADRVPVERIDRWLQLITTPEQALLRQVLQVLRTGLVAGQLSPSATETLGERCRQAAQPDLEAMVVEAQFAAAWSADDVDGCVELSERLIELHGLGVASAAHANHTRRIIGARNDGDQRRVIELIRDGRDMLGEEAGLGALATLELETLVALGRPFEALDRLRSLEDRLAAEKMRSVTFGLTYWFAGKPAEVIGSLDSLLVDEGRFHGIERSWITTAELFRRWRGIETDTPQRVEAPAHETLSTYSRVCEGLCEIGRLIELGREDDAAAAVRRLAERLPPTGGFTLTAWFMGAAAWYVLRPTDRPMLDAFMQEDLFAEANALFRSFLTARETGAVNPEDTAGWPTPEQIGILLPARWAAELALRLPSKRSELRANILANLEDRGMPAVQCLAESKEAALAHAAKEHLASEPQRPPHHVEVELFGPPTLRVEGHADVPDWRRSRVRTLLAVLATRPGVHRDTVSELLWPKLDPAGGRRNLRVTLSYLTRTLEPTRLRNAPAWFVRAEQDAIELLGDGIDIDVRVFDDHLQAAREHQSQGLASKAIDALRVACEAYRGPFLDGIDDDWVVRARAEYQHQAVGACCRLAELLAAGDLDEASRWAERAIALDPLSVEAHETLVSIAHDAAAEEAARVRFDALLEQLD